MITRFLHRTSSAGWKRGEQRSLCELTKSWYNTCMNIDEYSQKAIATLTNNYAYGTITPQLMGQVLGLSDESGEVLGKIKKILRDKAGVMTEDDKKEIVKELGDILWYINAVSHLLGSSLEEVAKANNEKLASRKERGVLGGSGDNR